MVTTPTGICGPVAPRARRGKDASVDTRETRYARPQGVYFAYQTVGDGPIVIVWQFDWFGNQIEETGHADKHHVVT